MPLTPASRGVTHRRAVRTPMPEGGAAGGLHAPAQPGSSRRGCDSARERARESSAAVLTIPLDGVHAAFGESSSRALREARTHRSRAPCASMLCHKHQTKPREPHLPPCTRCLQENSCCSAEADDLLLKTDNNTLCDLAQHGCQYDFRWCWNHRQLPLNSAVDRFLCAEHLADQLRKEQLFPSVINSKCAEELCFDRATPEPGKNRLHGCATHQTIPYSTTRAIWTPRRQALVTALQRAGMHGKEVSITEALEVPGIRRVYKTWEGGLCAHVCPSRVCHGPRRN